MELIFEKSRVGHGCSLLPACDVPVAEIPAREARKRLLDFRRWLKLISPDIIQN